MNEIILFYCKTYLNAGFQINAGVPRPVF